MDRLYILDEIRRTAAENDGRPLGRLRLEREAGIKQHHWKKYWARYGDALSAAGFAPNEKTVAINQDDLVQYLVALSRELGKFPTHADLVVKHTDDPQFPSETVFRRLGNKRDLVSKVAEYCATHPGHEDVLQICGGIPVARTSAVAHRTGPTDGFVYLLKSGRFYKIGKTNSVGRRERELAVQLPDAAKTIHSIKTDDPEGIEAYWHKRFCDKRRNGEWFELTAPDVSAFRRRKFM